MVARAADAGAQAAPSLNQPFPEGFALGGLEPSPAGDRFFAVADAAVSGDPQLYLKGVGDYVYGPALSREDNATGQQRDVIETQFFAHAGVSLALSDRFLLAVNVPYAVSQSGETGAANEPDGGVLGDVRGTARVALAGDSSSVAAFAAQLDVWAPTGDPDNLTGDESVRGEPKVVLGGRAGSFIWTSTLGYLFRKEQNPGSLEVGDAVTFGLGAGVLVADDALQIGPELYGNSQTDTASGTETTPIAAVLGAKYRVGDVVFGAGWGTGLNDAPGNAPRVLFSVGLIPKTEVTSDGSLSATTDTGGDTSLLTAVDRDTETDSDGDGVPDAEDDCPDAAATRDENRDGCTDDPKPVLPPDDDDDGVPDTEDACPHTKGVDSPDPARKGCPPGPADGDGDGVPDGDDQCPDQPGAAADSGCPKKQAQQAPPKPAPTPPAPDAGTGDSAIVSFAGFQLLSGGGSRLNVKLTRRVEVAREGTGKRLVFILKGSRIVIRNNRNPLLTTHFSSVVSSARLVPAGKDVQLVVELREEAAASQRMLETSAGAVLQIDLPPPRSDR